MGTYEGSAEGDRPPGQFGMSEIERRRPLSREEYRRFREEYGYLRAFFKTRPRRHAKIQQWLNQSHMGTTYEEYLARSVQYAVLIGALGAILGAVLTRQLWTAGTIAALRSPVPVGSDLAAFVSANRVYVVGLALTAIGGGVFGLATWAARYYHPRVRTSMRRQEINVVLPHAIVFLYALSHGGTSLFEAFRSLADARDTYGEVSNEFEMIVNDVELFGTDTYTAIRNARRLTPSRHLERFLDDLLSVLESGGDVTVFLGEEADTYLREAREEQRTFLETISLLAEVFVVLFVAAPLFLIITLVVIDILGGNSIGAISLLVYGGLPLAMIGFLLLIDLLGQPFEPPETVPELPRANDPVDEAEVETDEGFAAYRWNRRLASARDAVRNARVLLRLNPLYTLVLTVPAAIGTVAALVTSGRISADLAALTTDPLATTTALFVVPFLLIAVPLSAFHELKRRRERTIAHEFPETLNVLASANKMGISLVDALELISQWSSGVVGEELRKVRNDIVWNYDVRRALLALGNRTYVPQLGRTMKLLAEGIYSSGDLSKVLSIAATDTRNRDELERARRNELSTYIAVVVIGFLVYLLVVIMLDVGYLRTLSMYDTGTSGTGTSSDLLLSFASVPVETYRAVFFHSALIQAIGSGLLAGKLADNDALSGLKYAIALVVVTLGAFAVI